MQQNAESCYSRKKNVIEYPFTIQGSLLEERSISINDLGIIFDSKLTFVDHISQKGCESLKSYGFTLGIVETFTPN